jgi:hypothetical protein
MTFISAPFALCASVATLACACAVHPGLANAPQLGGTADADPRVHDVIANGQDSCGRQLDPGPLRNRLIPCPRTTQPRSTAMSFAPSPEYNEIVTPWVEHYHWRWACPSIDHKLSLRSREFGPLLTADTSPTGGVAFSGQCPGIRAP